MSWNKVGLTRAAYLRGVNASGWSLEMFEGPRRWTEIVYARKALIYAMVERGVSFHRLAALMGRDRTTVRHSYRVAHALFRYDAEFVRLVRRIQNAVFPAVPERLAA